MNKKRVALITLSILLFLAGVFAVIRFVDFADFSICKREPVSYEEESKSKEETKSDIKVETPQPNDVVVSPFMVEGEARGTWFFEAVFPVKLVDEKGETITTAIATTQEEWMQEDFIPFQAEVQFKSPGTDKGFLILEKANPSGLPEHADEVKIPVRFEVEKTTLSLYFNNTETDSICENVTSVSRKVPKTEGIARAALNELLKGPTAEEKKQGFATAINEGVEIQRLVIENGVAEVDFNDRLGWQVGGSCRVNAIRAQIEETLKQFPTVDEVVISIEGEKEVILQP